jgi:hypothetical protein
MKTLFAILPAVGSLLLGGCIQTGGSAADDRASALVGQKIDAAYAEFGSEDYVGGSGSRHTNIGTEASPRYGHNWTRHGGTYDRFVQTGTGSMGQVLVGEIPAGPGTGAIPIYQDQPVPTGYHEQATADCILFLATDRTDTIIEYSYWGTDCDTLFAKG